VMCIKAFEMKISFWRSLNCLVYVTETEGGI